MRVVYSCFDGPPRPMGDLKYEDRAACLEMTCSARQVVQFQI